jgi:hypothetical protein
MVVQTILPGGGEMKQVFYDLIAYLDMNEDSFHFDGEFCLESLKSEILAFASEFEKGIQ